MSRGQPALPEGLSAIVEFADRISAVHHVAQGGITAELVTRDGDVFLKAARRLEGREGPRLRSLWHEALVYPYVVGIAPRFLWAMSAGEWVTLGLEHVHGRHADYAPGSPDLSVLAGLIACLQQVPCPPTLTRFEERWAGWGGDVSPLAGDALLHTGLAPAHLLIAPGGRAYVVSWGAAARGAPWIEIGQVIPWLLAAGHHPASAEQWAESNFPCWRDADPAAVDLYVALEVEYWSRRKQPSAWARARLKLLQQWADYRAVP